MLELKDKWVWDFWLCRHRDAHHMFYLQAPRALGDERLRHFNASLGHAVSEDLKNWRVLPDALHPGSSGSWDDLATWTGSVIEADGTWYLFYTGVNQAEKGLIQRIGAARSSDLIHWERVGDAPLIEADPTWYERLNLDAWHDEAWRDPWVFKHEDRYHALITARCKSGAPDGRGVIGHAVSNDLLNWKVGPPLSEPGAFGQLEVPQLIEVNGHYRLLFSTDRFSHSKPYVSATGQRPVTGTAWLHADSPLGPFRLPSDPWLFADEVGSRYSGKVIAVGDASWTCLAFENYSKDGSFAGRILNPFLVSAPG